MLDFLYRLLKRINHEYVERAYCFEHDKTLIVATTIADMFIALVCIIVGFLIFKSASDKEDDTLTMIHKPLGLFFICIGIVFCLLIFNIWEGYYWYTVMMKIVAALGFGVYILVHLQSAIQHRKTAQEALKEMKKSYQELLKLKDAFTPGGTDSNNI